MVPCSDPLRRVAARGVLGGRAQKSRDRLARHIAHHRYVPCFYLVITPLVPHLWLPIGPHYFHLGFLTLFRCSESRTYSFWRFPKVLAFSPSAALPMASACLVLCSVSACTLMWVRSSLVSEASINPHPPTDPYVVHHGALGSYATVYLNDQSQRMCMVCVPRYFLSHDSPSDRARDLCDNARENVAQMVHCVVFRMLRIALTLPIERMTSASAQENTAQTTNCVLCVPANPVSSTALTRANHPLRRVPSCLPHLSNCSECGIGCCALMRRRGHGSVSRPRGRGVRAPGRRHRRHCGLRRQVCARGNVLILARACV